MNTTVTTIDYYNINADIFVATTASVDFRALQETFMTYLPPHAAVLDVGCGSGRDSLAFLQAGHEVTAIDGSHDMTERRFNNVLHALPDLHLDRQFITGDARPNRAHEKWLNVFLIKR